MGFKVIKYTESKKGYEREVVTWFAERWEAEEFVKIQAQKAPLKLSQGIPGEDISIRYELEEAPKLEPVSKQGGAPVESGQKTITDLIAEAIGINRGKAELKQIYPVVEKARPGVPRASVRADLYHGIDAGKFRRNSDRTYGWGIKLRREILNRPVNFSFSETIFHPPFHGVVSVPLEGVVTDGHLLEPVRLSEEELEKEFLPYYKQVLGKGTHYLPIRQLVGARLKKVTDGLLIDLNNRDKPGFWIVEFELSTHPLERHVQTQVAGFLRAFKDEKTLRTLAEVVHENLSHSEDKEWYSSFFMPTYIEQMFPGEVPESYKFLDSLLHGNCGILIIIDRVTPELREIVEFLSGKNPVRVIEFKTFKKNGELVHTFSQPDSTQSD